MTTHSSAQACAETPHATNSITNNTISDAVRRRAHSLINDRTIDANERVWIRYALETNDAAGLAELVRRADAGEPIIDDSHLLEANEELSIEESSNVSQALSARLAISRKSKRQHCLF